MKRVGVARLPLHYGKAPRWLFTRMVKLARGVASAVVEEYGPEELVRRLSDPYWFQALGCALGFDWHSSGLTTTTCAALKLGLSDREKELGIFVAGGKGKTSRKTPAEIEDCAEKYNLHLDPAELVYASRMSAKVDNTALQDGYQIYQHNFVFTRHGLWTVIQQGMNENTRWARRYHWLSAEVKSFVCEPEKAICCDHAGEVVNLVARESEEARAGSASIAREHPEKVFKKIKDVCRLNLPVHHRVFFSSLKPESLKKVLISTYENHPEDFEQLLGIKGVGPRTVRALSLLSELIYGTRISRLDPVKYSFAHGGKDGHPYPVDRNGYDCSIRILHRAVADAKIGRTEKKQALMRLARFQ